MSSYPLRPQLPNIFLKNLLINDIFSSLSSIFSVVSASVSINSVIRCGGTCTIIDFSDLFFGVEAYPTLCRFTQLDNWSFCAFFHVHSFSKDLLDRTMLLVYFRIMGTTMASSLAKIRLALPYPLILNAGILLCRSVVREGATGMKGTPHRRLRPEQE